MNNWNPQTANAYVNYRKDALAATQVNRPLKNDHPNKNSRKRKNKLFR